MPCASLGGRSFAQCLDDALGAAQEISRACPPQAVILTGGASRMAFFREACRAAFPQSLLVLCPEPECSIARGLAYAGRVDEQLKTFRQEVASIARGEKLQAAVNARVHELYTPLAQALFEAARDTALETVGLWRRGGVDTIDELDAMLEQRIADAFAGEAVAGRIREHLRGWTDGLMRELEGELTSLCMRCGVPAERMSLSGTQISAGVNGVNLSLTSAMGMDVFSGVLGVVLGAVGAGLCGGSGVALVSAGPVGMAAGAAAGVLLAILGKGEMEKLVRGMKIPMLLRQMVTDGAVRAGVNRQEEAMKRSIVTALADPANGFAARLASSIAGTLGVQLERMAQHAEMSICA